MRNIPDNTDDTIDSRDIIARMEELTEERDGLAEALTDAEGVEPADPEDTDDCERIEADADAARDALSYWDSENGDELKHLTALCKEAGGYAEDWEYGVTLIRDSYFMTYAMELADDIGALEGIGDKWPATCIDWDKAARELQMDYTSVEFGGATYWVR